MFDFSKRRERPQWNEKKESENCLFIGPQSNIVENFGKFLENPR